MSSFASLNRAELHMKNALRTLESLQDTPFPEADADVRRCGLALREASILLYKFSTELVTYGMPESSVIGLYGTQLCMMDHVAAFLDNSTIHIHTPLLGNRQSREQNFTKDILFADSVHYAICSAPNYDSYDFALFQRKAIMFLFVYSTESARRGWIADCDNHEIKYVLDAIAAYLPEGDSPLSTSIRLITVVTDTVEEGTYICVSPEMTGEPNTEEMLSFWSKTANSYQDLKKTTAKRMAK